MNPISTLQRAHRGEERLWRIWWLLGVPVAMLANALTVGAEALHGIDYRAAGDALDVLKFLFYLAWFRLAWRCANNTDYPLWTLLTRLAVGAGLGATAVFV